MVVHLSALISIFHNLIRRISASIHESCTFIVSNHIYHKKSKEGHLTAGFPINYPFNPMKTTRNVLHGIYLPVSNVIESVIPMLLMYRKAGFPHDFSHRWGQLVPWGNSSWACRERTPAMSTTRTQKPYVDHISRWYMWYYICTYIYIYICIWLYR